jgi:hypothetical protein
MGWHTRHASTLSGLEEHSRSETLNLTAWNHAQGPGQVRKEAAVSKCLRVPQGRLV